LPLVTQGFTLDEVVNNLKEAIELHFKDESPADFGYVSNSSVIIACELEPVYAKA